MIMGTSICHMLLGKEKQMVEGMCGTVEDGIVPGLWGYEAGQSAVGDIFAWFFEHGVPDYIHHEARKMKAPFQVALEKRAAALKPGQSGLVALDWWNGNRSVLVDVDLTGVLLGMTLATRAEEIYRALIEATAFGTRTIIEAFESKGITVNELVACGGLPEKNHLLMQIYADVTGREIKLADPLQTCSALGAAMHGAVAAGAAAGGYDSIVEAARQMARVQKLTFKPHAESPRHLRPALCGIPCVARLLRPRRKRRDEAAEDFETGDGSKVSCQLPVVSCPLLVAGYWWLASGDL